MRKIFLACALLLAAAQVLHAQSTIWGMNSFTNSADGNVFSMNADGSGFQLKHTFLDEAINPGLPNFGYFSDYWLEGGQLVQYNGKFYGMRVNGGPNTAVNGNNGGVLFQFDPATGQDSTLYQFSLAAGCNPLGGVTMVNGILWGMTAYGGNTSLNNGNGYGTIFSYNLGTGEFTTVYKFSGTPDGGKPMGTLFLNPGDNLLYGETSTGGPTAANTGTGTLFSIDPAAGASSFQVRANYGGMGGLTLYNGLLYGESGEFNAGTSFIFSYNPTTTVYTNLAPLSGGAINTLTVYNGLLYGLTYSGGTHNGGNLFSFDPATATYTDLFDMQDGSSDPNGGRPAGALTVYNGQLWGACSSGGIPDNNDGQGILFSYNPTTSVYTPQYQFGWNDYNYANNYYYEGYNCYGGVIAYNNKLYGVAGDQGISGGGTIFSWNPATSQIKNELFFNINAYNGKGPTGHLYYNSDHLLYGVTSQGGLVGAGVLFSLDPVSNSFKMLRGFNLDTVGGAPSGNPVALNGKLYGVASQGGLAPTNGQGGASGSIYQYDPSTGLTTFPYIFSTSSGGSSPQGPLVVYNGLLYGVAQYGGASGGGTIYSYNPATQAYTVIYSFTNATTGSSPMVLLQSNGVFYGYTNSGGPKGNGLVFSYNPGSGVLTDLLDFGGTTVTFTTPQALTLYNNVLYGAAFYGGANGKGGIYSINLATGTAVDLYDFTTALYTTDLLGHDGQLLGMDLFHGANGNGYLYSLNLSSRGFTDLHDFNLATDGADPAGLMVLKSVPVIAFGAVNATYGQADMTLPATSTNTNAANPMTFTVGDPSVASIVGGKLHILKAGTTTITAIQAEDDDYYADTVKATLTVAKAPLTITAQPVSIVYGTAIPASFTASYSGFVGTDDATVLSGAPVFTTAATTSSLPGTYPINVDTTQLSAANYYFVVQAGVLTISAATPTITFGAVPSTLTYGDAPFDPGAVSSSGAAVVYTSSNVSVASITGDNKVQLTGAGTAVITASFPATATYAAGSQTLTITVQPKTLTLVVNNAYMIVGSALPTFTATFNGLVNGDPASVVSPALQFATTASSGSVAGTYPITVSNVASLTAANYVVSASYTSGLLTIGSVSFAGADTRVYGVAPYDPGATSSAGGVPVYTSSNTAVAVVTSGGLVSVVGAGTTVITATFAASGSTPAANAQQTLTVQPAPLAITASNVSRGYGQPNPVFSFTYSGFVYNDNASYLQTPPQGGTPAGLASDPGTYPITPYGATSANYLITNVAGVLTVTPASQTINFGALPTEATGNPDFTLTASASSGLPVSYTSSNVLVATVDGFGVVHITGAGTTTITASQGGNSDYLAAVPVQQTLTVNGLPANIILPAIPTVVYGAPDFTVAATSTNATAPIVYISSNVSVATVDGSGLVHIVGAGVTTITATQAGSNIYSAGSSVPQTLNVNPAPVLVTVANQTLYQSQSPAAFAISYSGFVNGDDTTVLAARAVGSTPASSSSPAGAYPIYLSGASAVDYTFTYVQGVITVLPGDPQTISFNPLPAESYGNADFDPGASTSSGQPVVYTSSDTTVAVIVGGLVHLIGAGQVTITATQPGGNGYGPAVPVSQTITVGQATLVIRPNDVTLGPGQPVPVLGVGYTGFVNNDDSTVLSKLPVVTTTASSVSPAFGQYAINASGALSTNYAITYQPGILTVTAGSDQLNAFESAPGALTVSIYTNTVQQATIQLFSLSGQLVKAQQVQLFLEVNNFTLNTGNIAAGIYIVKVWGDVTRLSQKIKID